MIAAMLAGVAVPAEAFGLKTHLWIAQTIYQDMADCKLELRNGRAFAVPEETCTAILAHRGEFLAGAIGPDAFPDIMTGQTIIHPGDKGPWVTADWMDHLLGKAEHPSEIAFGAGFLLHAAGDIFAHSYVNNYAGDFFSIMDERLVERRHTLLERYIDQHLPDPAGGPILSGDLDAPFGFLADKLIFHPQARAANATKPTGWHHSAFAGLRNEVLGFMAEAKERRNVEQAGYDAARRTAEAARRASDSAPGDDGLRKAAEKAEKALARAVIQLADAREALAFTTEWERSLQIAAREFLRASLDTSRQMLGDSSPPGEAHAGGIADIGRHYARWYDCHGHALLGEPVDIGRARCATMGQLGLRQDYRDLRLQAAFPRFGRFLSGFRAWRKQVGEEAAEALLKNSLAVLRTTRGLILDMTGPEPVTRARLDSVFGVNENKALLTFPRTGLSPAATPPDARTIWSIIEEDMHVDREGGRLDPGRFRPLDYALLLGKLALLDRSGLKEVAAAYGGEPERVVTSARPVRYSILMDTARSLDGNHQWMRHAPPYPRQSGEAEPLDPAKREYGFGPASPGDWKGFPFFADSKLRATVFRQLFPEPFEGGILCRAEFRLPAYGHPVEPDDPFRSDREKFCASGGN